MEKLILPDAVYTQLQHLLDMETIPQWAVGDFIVDVWAEIERYVPEKERKQAHAEMIRDMATNTGADKSTLRSREKMSEFYTKEDREAWMPPLSYHHLRALMSAGDEWREVAIWAQTGSFAGGVATVADIRAKIKGDKTPEQLTHDRLMVLDGKFQVLLGDFRTDPKTKMAIAMMSILLGYVNSD
jgi:hypothetical protein